MKQWIQPLFISNDSSSYHQIMKLVGTPIEIATGLDSLSVTELARLSARLDRPIIAESYSIHFGTHAVPPSQLDPITIAQHLGQDASTRVHVHCLIPGSPPLSFEQSLLGTLEHSHSAHSISCWEDHFRPHNLVAPLSSYGDCFPLLSCRGPPYASIAALLSRQPAMNIYESHLTVLDLHHQGPDLFQEHCSRLGVKPLLIQLQSGNPRFKDQFQVCLLFIKISYIYAFFFIFFYFSHYFTIYFLIILIYSFFFFFWYYVYVIRLDFGKQDLSIKLLRRMLIILKIFICLVGKSSGSNAKQSPSLIHLRSHALPLILMRRSFRPIITSNFIWNSNCPSSISITTSLVFNLLSKSTKPISPPTPLNRSSIMSIGSSLCVFSPSDISRLRTHWINSLKIWSLTVFTSCKPNANMPS